MRDKIKNTGLFGRFTECDKKGGAIWPPFCSRVKFPLFQPQRFPGFTQKVFRFYQNALQFPGGHSFRCILELCRRKLHACYYVL